MAGEKNMLNDVDGIKFSNSIEVGSDGILSPAQITANTHDYDPTGFRVSNKIDVSILRMSSDANRDLTGLVPSSPAAGNIVTITNIGGDNIKLKNNNGGSLAANRFLTKGDINIEPNESFTIYYDTVDLRWRTFNKI